jgi:hypothetical protein
VNEKKEEVKIEEEEEGLLTLLGYYYTDGTKTGTLFRQVAVTIQ